MQTFDVLIAPGLSSSSVSCFLLLPPFSFPFSSPVGRDHSGKQERGFQPHPLTHPARQSGGCGLTPSWLFARSRWRGQGCQMWAVLSAKLTGSTATRG